MLRNCVVIWVRSSMYVSINPRDFNQLCPWVKLRLEKVALSAGILGLLTKQLLGFLVLLVLFVFLFFLVLLFLRLCSSTHRWTYAVRMREYDDYVSNVSCCCKRVQPLRTFFTFFFSPDELLAAMRPWHGSSYSTDRISHAKGLRSPEAI